MAASRGRRWSGSGRMAPRGTRRGKRAHCHGGRSDGRVETVFGDTVETIDDGHPPPLPCGGPFAVGHAEGLRGD